MAQPNPRLWLRSSSNDDAVLSAVDSTFLAALPPVFLEGVSLKCCDLRGAGLTLREAGSLGAAALEASLLTQALALAEART
jgi:hypothetical protein